MLIYRMTTANGPLNFSFARSFLLCFLLDGLWNWTQDRHTYTHATEEIQNKRKLIHYRLLDIIVTQTYPKKINKWKSKKMNKKKKLKKSRKQTSEKSYRSKKLHRNRMKSESEGESKVPCLLHSIRRLNQCINQIRASRNTHFLYIYILVYVYIE